MPFEATNAASAHIRVLAPLALAPSPLEADYLHDVPVPGGGGIRRARSLSHPRPSSHDGTWTLPFLPLRSDHQMGVRGSTPDGPYIHRAGAAHVTFRLLSHRSGAIYPDPYGEVISEHPPAFRWGPPSQFPRIRRIVAQNAHFCITSGIRSALICSDLLCSDLM